jgi:hypothetical protein
MIHVDWGNLEESLIVWKIGAYWSMSAFHEAFTRTQWLLRTKTHKVHILLDLQRVEYIDPDMICPIFASFQHHPPHVGRTVIISENPRWQALWDDLMAARDPHRAIYFVRSANDAYHLVADVLL